MLELYSNISNKKILIVDDHPVVTMCIKSLLSSYDTNVFFEAKDGWEALGKIKKINPDIVILDLHIPGLDGIGITKRSRISGYQGKIMIFTAQSKDYYSLSCKEAGANAFVSKEKSADEILLALKSIIMGYDYFPSFSYTNTNKNTLEERVKNLSEREMITFKLLAEGSSNKEIADKLLLSGKTISTYKKRLMDKLGVKSIVDIIKIADENNLIP